MYSIANRCEGQPANILLFDRSFEELRARLRPGVDGLTVDGARNRIRGKKGTQVVLTVSRGGYVKRTPLSVYRAQKRGGKGRMGAQTKEEDVVEHLFVASTHAYILAFTSKGRMHWIKVYEVPQLGPATRGKAIEDRLFKWSGRSADASEGVRAFLEKRKPKWSSQA